VPDKEIKGAYGPGDDYEFYRDLKTIVQTANASLFIIDNYLDEQLFDLYMEKAASGVDIRILTDRLRGAVQVIAEKFSKRGSFELRTSGGTHDRHVFLDDRGWVIGQSIKDAAQRKPTYIVELNDVAAFLNIYNTIWSTATLIVKS
jgi:phosphatidylserine/phosphatidylglycerophosphate/cardiolipin synthase-like enzyme